MLNKDCIDSHKLYLLKIFINNIYFNKNSKHEILQMHIVQISDFHKHTLCIMSSFKATLRWHFNLRITRIYSQSPKFEKGYLEHQTLTIFFRRWVLVVRSPNKQINLFFFNLGKPNFLLHHKWNIILLFCSLRFLMLPIYNDIFNRLYCRNKSKC